MQGRAIRDDQRVQGFVGAHLDQFSMRHHFSFLDPHDPNPWLGTVGCAKHQCVNSQYMLWTVLWARDFET